MEQIYEKIMQLMRECGDVMQNADRSQIDVDSKAGHGNFVTKYDTMIQDMLEKGLKEIMPEAAFVGEEQEQRDFPREGYAFIVDPIDGTTNFIKDLHFSCIAVGLIHDLDRIAGFVYNPYADEMFSAVKGQGAYLNGKPIHVSGASLENSVVLIGTAPYYDDMAELCMKKATEYVLKAIDVRRGGSAELDLCTLACGRAEVYFEPRLQPWDFCAGSLIVEEAGGKVTQTDGSPLDVTRPCSLLAQGSGVHLTSW